MKTTFKKVLSLVMILMMVVSTMVILPLTASAETGEITPVKPEGYGDNGAIGQSADNPYVISERGHLVYLAQSELESGYFVLANDIDMAGVTNFLALKCPSDDSSYVFDGNGYAIKNLTVQDGFATTSSNWVGGLFGLTRGYVTIKNLKMESLTVDNTWEGSNNTQIGGLVGEAQSKALTIENVMVDSNSAITCDREESTRVGGFIGQANARNDYQGTVTITNSVCDAAVTAYEHYDGETYAGGFVGGFNPTSTLTFENCTRGGVTKGRTAGGFVNFSSAADNNFKNCTLKAGVSQNGNNKYIGGFMAYADSFGNVTVDNCVIEEVEIYGPSPKIGAILGWGNGIGAITITNTVNKACISHSADQGGQVGGFIGRADKPNGITITRCVNMGDIGYAASSNAFTAGGFIGLVYGNQSAKKTIKMEYCLNLGDIYSSGSVGGLIGNTNDGSGTRNGGTFDYDFDYCGNMGDLTTYLLESGGMAGGGYAGHNGMGGLVGAIYDNQATEATTFTADNCFNTGSMTHDAKFDYWGTNFHGFGGLLGFVLYEKMAGNTVTFDNCFVNATATNSRTELDDRGNPTIAYSNDFVGSDYNWEGVDNQEVIVEDTCKMGEEAAEGIAAINAAIFALDASTAGGKLSVRMKLKDDLGFMAILEGGAFMQGAAEYGFCFATEAFDDVADATKVAGAKYNGDNSRMYAAYTDLTAATLDTPVYFAAYVVVNGVTYMSQVRTINCFNIVDDLQDGYFGDASTGVFVTDNATEMALYSQMLAYHNTANAYLDDVQ